MRLAKVLRTAAMQAKLRIGQIAQQVIGASRNAEAFDRSGQLRSRRSGQSLSRDDVRRRKA